MKYEDLIKDEYRRKDYFKTLDLEGARLRFRISSNMVESVRSNFPGQYRANGKPLTCPFGWDKFHILSERILKGLFSHSISCRDSKTVKIFIFRPLLLGATNFEESIFPYKYEILKSTKKSIYMAILVSKVVF